MSPEDQDQSPTRVCIGKIAAAHGVKGLVKIRPYGEDPALLEQVEDFKITLKNPLGKYMLAEIDGITDRTTAEALKGTELYVQRESLPDLEDGHYFEDLVGLSVTDENGAEIGTVTLADNFGASDLIEIKGPKGEFMLPFTDEHLVEVSDKIIIKNYEQFIL